MSSQYKHTKTGDVYLIHESCKIKIDDKWVEGIIYFNPNNIREMFVTTKEDFFSSFEEIIDEGDL
jgi:uncharacterized membrane protein